MSGIRTAGGGLLASAIVFMITILVFQIVLGPDSTPETSAGPVSRGEHLLANQSTYLAFWTAEALAMGLLAASAFILAFRGGEAVGSALGWSLFGVGSLANIGMYAFVMGSYFVAARVVATNTIPYEVAQAAAFAIFNIANALAFLGLALVLSSLVRAPVKFLPSWLCWIGLAASVTAALAAVIGMATAMDTMMWMGPGALVGYITVAILGFRIMRRAG